MKYFILLKDSSKSLQFLEISNKYNVLEPLKSYNGLPLKDKKYIYSLDITLELIFLQILNYENIIYNPVDIYIE